MSVNTVLEIINHVVSIFGTLWGVGYGLWKEYKVKDDAEEK